MEEEHVLGCHISGGCRQGVLPAGGREWMCWRMGTVGTACSLLCFTGYRCTSPLLSCLGFL